MRSFWRGGVVEQFSVGCPLLADAGNAVSYQHDMVVILTYFPPVVPPVSAPRCLIKSDL